MKWDSVLPIAFLGRLATDWHSGELNAAIKINANVYAKKLVAEEFIPNGPQDALKVSLFPSNAHFNILHSFLENITLSNKM